MIAIMPNKPSIISKDNKLKKDWLINYFIVLVLLVLLINFNYIKKTIVGIFSFLRSISDGFFNALSDNTQKKVYNDTPPLPKDESDILNNIQKEKDYLNSLLDKYDKPNSNKELKLEIGITRKELRQLKGMEQHTVLNSSRGKEIAKLYYGKKKNRLGNDSYEFEVTLQDGKVTGWKDLTNVGTRSK